MPGRQCLAPEVSELWAGRDQDPTGLFYPFCTPTPSPPLPAGTWILLLGCNGKPLPPPQGLQANQIRHVAVGAHHRHLLALGNGPAAAAQPGLVPAHPVHLLTSSLLLPVEEALVHQEPAPEGSLQELQGLGGS